MGADKNYSLPENIFQIIFEKSPGSLLVKADKSQFTIVAVSDSYLKVTATTREAILGKGFFEVFPDNELQVKDESGARNVFTRVVETGEKIDVHRYRYDIYNSETKSLEVHYWSCSNVPILGSDQKIAYILNTVSDITEEVRAKEAAVESTNRLQMATDATGLATWDLNLKTQVFITSPRMAEIFGHSADTSLTLTELRSQIATEDMEHIIRRSYIKALTTGEYYYEVKIKWPDQSVHWIKTQGIIIFDNDKHPLRMLGTILDITENKRDEIRKNDFIAMASHELKTPLTSLKAYVQLLAKKLAKANDPFIDNALAKADNQVNKMSDLIYAFLDLSRLESGKLHITKQPFDINKLIADTIAETNLLSYSHHINFKPKGVIMVNADMEKIGQVINNFLNNAIKYSPKENPINVSCKIIDNNVQVAVSDKGIGIKQRDQEKLFQRFYRVDNDRIKNISGFGIGLYLSSEIIQHHKGKIGVESKEDEGSTFYFTLPLFNS